MGSLGGVKAGGVELPLGYRPSYFVLEGGTEWGGVSGSPKLPRSVAPPPRACWELVECARLELPSWPLDSRQLGNWRATVSDAPCIHGCIFNVVSFFFFQKKKGTRVKMGNWHLATLICTPINILTCLRLKEVTLESLQMLCPADSSLSALHHLRQMLG